MFLFCCFTAVILTGCGSTGAKAKEAAPLEQPEMTRAELLELLRETEQMAYPLHEQSVVHVNSSRTTTIFFAAQRCAREREDADCGALFEQCRKLYAEISIILPKIVEINSMFDRYRLERDPTIEFDRDIYERCLAGRKELQRFSSLYEQWKPIRDRLEIYLAKRGLISKNTDRWQVEVLNW
jgi:hypothetical protein